MTIEFHCPTCRTRIRSSAPADRQVKCPECASIVSAPRAWEDYPDDPHAVWLVMAPDGERFGPVSETELQEWVADGRVTADSQLLRRDSQAWRWAGDVHPALFESAAADAHASDAPPTDETTVFPEPPPSPGAATPIEPHRGGSILAFAVLGVFCCGFFSIAAWAMASTDLAQIQAGKMDPSGESITRVGQIIGIVGVVLMVMGALGGAVSVLN